MDYYLKTKNGDMLVETYTKELNKQLVTQLVAKRKELKMKQQDIADLTGISRPNVARIEGKKHETSLEVLFKYADAVGMKIDISLVEK